MMYNITTVKKFLNDGQRNENENEQMLVISDDNWTFWKIYP